MRAQVGAAPRLVARQPALGVVAKAELMVAMAELRKTARLAAPAAQTRR
jgi:hypothetical protein